MDEFMCLECKEIVPLHRDDGTDGDCADCGRCRECCEARKGEGCDYLWPIELPYAPI